MAGDARALELISLGEKLYTDQKQLDSLCQEIAWQFAPDLASFTTKLILGQDFAIDRMDSFPEQMSRELANQLGAMLRPNDRPWYRVTTLNSEIDADEDNARYLEYVGRTMHQGIYDPRSKFVRATKMADRFFVNFGQAVISVEEAPQTRDHLFFRNFHTKDCAWLENELGEIDHLHRKEQITARKMVERFSSAGDSLSSNVKEAAEKKPNDEIEMRVVVLPSDEYDLIMRGARGKKSKLPFVVVYVDVKNQRVVRESGLPTFPYIVPRWMPFAEGQYAFSPCTMSALPDARMAQMMNQIILEAGEKSIDPPLIAKQEVVIGEPNIQAGGISWVDLEHDANLKEALDAIRLEPDMKTGFEMRKDLRDMLAKAFYIDKLAMPEPTPRMTAYEYGRRIEEHVRNLLPMFEPMQLEYNTRLLDKVYATMENMRQFRTDGANGTPPMPPALSGTDVTWSFESPIQQAQEQILVEYFKGSLELVGLGMQAGATANPLNTDRALRDAVRGLGTPATWRKNDAELQQAQQELAQQKQQMEAMQQASAVAGIAHQAGQAGSQMGDAAQKFGLLPPNSQKVVQGSAQGSPDLAGAKGMSAPDVGDQGPAANPNENVPQPWMPNQTSAVLAQHAGTSFAPAAQGAPEQQAAAPEAAPQQSSTFNPPSVIQQIEQTQEWLISRIQDLEKGLKTPKKITVHRDAKGRITGATATPQ